MTWCWQNIGFREITNKLIKCFIRYNDDDVIRPLCIKLSQMIGYVKCFDSNKTMSFKATD